MRIAVFSSKPYDRRFLDEANQRYGFDLTYFEPRLTRDTCPLAEGFDAVCAFVNDQLDRPILVRLAGAGIRAIALRCAGFNNVDVAAAAELGIPIARVPAYSPHAVAEHTVGLILALNRKIHRAHNRVREGNFSLEGLLGFDLHGKTVGIIGTGAIGSVFARIMNGFGCRVVAYDIRENDAVIALGGRYVPLTTLFAESDIISLHCPLTPDTRHLIDDDAIDAMKPGVMIVNTSRGAVVDTEAAIRGLKSGKLGALALDVYEEEEDLFFEDLSNTVIQDDTIARLLTFPNVLITGHQAFFTVEAMRQIAETTLRNLHDLRFGVAKEENLVQLGRGAR
ncbi:MAG: 2-hydroxyacid dehydrogenase [Dehalococcoidia bacterium]|nr:2-hydroxyacid dehydrogenase [Dehalococcoidia bacterium]